MSKKVIDSPKDFKNIIGESLGTTNWKEVTQKEIDSLLLRPRIFNGFMWIKKKLLQKVLLKKL